MRRLIFALAGLAVLATTPALADSCIRHDDLYNWSSINDKTVILENFRHEKWLAKLVGTCGNFKFHERIEIRSPGALGISCIEKVFQEAEVDFKCLQGSRRNRRY